MENGGENLENKFAGLVLKDSNHNGAGNDGLFQVMKAGEAAEATIKQQVEENNRLRAELLKKIQEVEKYGERVKVFANEHKKISCDPEMQNCIKTTVYSGHASYKVSLSLGYFDIWEPATLWIKRDGYSIKCRLLSGVVSEKFSNSTIVSIPCGSPTEFSIVDGQGVKRLLRAENGLNDICCSRDTIVLTLRLFIVRANEKKKGKKRGLFFYK